MKEKPYSRIGFTVEELAEGLVKYGELLKKDDVRKEMKPLTIIESPYAGDVERNLEYAKLCMLDSIQRGELPFASHLLYTQMLDDDVPEERTLGIELGMQMMNRADKVAVYSDLGISNGMQYGIKQAEENNKVVEYRELRNG